MADQKTPDDQCAAGKNPTNQRIDKWLWCARFFKTRSLATKFVSAGQIRLTRDGATERIEKPSALIRPLDELAFSRGERLFIIKVLGCALRRGPAPEARLLYEDNSPPPIPKTKSPVSPFTREKGSGRPTKKDRRALDTLIDKSSD